MSYVKKLSSILESEHFFGGLADFAADEDFNAEQIKMGIEVEMEHTNDPEMAKEIAKDHLKEDPRYYTKLKKIESGH